jgi:hypothetical protein
MKRNYKIDYDFEDIAVNKFPSTSKIKNEYYYKKPFKENSRNDEMFSFE